MILQWDSSALKAGPQEKASLPPQLILAWLRYERNRVVG